MSGPIRVVAGALLGMLVVLGVTRMVVARSWDLAVTVGKEIEFFAENGSLTGKTIIADASALVGMAYDDDTYTMFLSDAKNRNYSIFSVDLTAKNFTAKPLLKREQDLQVLSMVFDSQSRSLFWTSRRSIMRMRVPMNAAPSTPEILHRLEFENPRGIALDACNRHIYWANSNRSNPSIMRSNLDGSNRTTIITDNIYEPLAVAVDHFSSKLYWIDDEEGIHYKVEKSNLDGSERSLVVHSKHNEPVHLAADHSHVYWTDYVYSAVWRINKDARPGDLPENFTTYDAIRQSDPTSIIARDNLGRIDCKAMRKREETKRKMGTTMVTPKPTLQSFNNLTTSAENAEPEITCFNGGFVQNTNGACRCKPGYSGSRCEISACHNYCLRGECVVNDKGMPVCKCGASHSGQRCEHDVCNGYCLNEGRCSINDGKPTCECKYSNGPRCEVTFDMGEICALYCVNRQLQMTSIDTSSCRCAELNQTIEEVLSYDTFNCTILVPLLSLFVGMLVIVVIFLSVLVSKLKRRPRIKKRFVVNKAGITPLTSRPSQIAGDQCEITIENCCNMNICETPCFEPKLRSSNPRSVKKEEKSNLLDHMEDSGNSC